jgi:hypothetical protein
MPAILQNSIQLQRELDHQANLLHDAAKALEQFEKLQKLCGRAYDTLNGLLENENDVDPEDEKLLEELQDNAIFEEEESW